MSDTRQKYLCDAIAVVNAERLFITVCQVNDGIEFESGRGEVKYGSPRRVWTPALIRHEIAKAFGAQAVQITNMGEPAVAALRDGDSNPRHVPTLPPARPVRRSNPQSR